MMKKPTVAETLESIQKTRIPYGPDKQARFVEGVCATLEESRMGFRSEDAIRLIEHDGDDEGFSYIDLFGYIAQNPVATWDGEKLVDLIPGEALHLILINPECRVSILSRRDASPSAPT